MIAAAEQALHILSHVGVVVGQKDSFHTRACGEGGSFERSHVGASGTGGGPAQRFGYERVGSGMVERCPAVSLTLS